MLGPLISSFFNCYIIIFIKHIPSIHYVKRNAFKNISPQNAQIPYVERCRKCYYQHAQVIMILELGGAVIEMSGCGNHFPSHPAKLEELTPTFTHEPLPSPDNYFFGNTSGIIPTSSITRGIGYPRGRSGNTRRDLTRAPRNNSTIRERKRVRRGGRVRPTKESSTRGRRGPNCRVIYHQWIIRFNQHQAK